MTNGAYKSSVVLSLACANASLSRLADSILKSDLLKLDWTDTSVSEPSLIDIRYLNRQLRAFGELHAATNGATHTLTGVISEEFILQNETSNQDLQFRTPIQLVWHLLKLGREVHTDFSSRQDPNGRQTTHPNERRHAAILVSALNSKHENREKREGKQNQSNQAWHPDILKQNVTTGVWATFDHTGNRVSSVSAERLWYALEDCDLHPSYQLFVTRSFCLCTLLSMGMNQILVELINKAENLAPNLGSRLTDRRLKAFGIKTIDRILSGLHKFRNQKVADVCLFLYATHNVRNKRIIGLALMPFLVPKLLFARDEDERGDMPVNDSALLDQLNQDLQEQFVSLGAQNKTGRRGHYRHFSDEDEKIIQNLTPFIRSGHEGNYASDCLLHGGSLETKIKNKLDPETMSKIPTNWNRAFMRQKDQKRWNSAKKPEVRS